MYSQSVETCAALHDANFDFGPMMLCIHKRSKARDREPIGTRAREREPIGTRAREREPIGTRATDRKKKQ